jgi:dienelactone hydrolase
VLSGYCKGGTYTFLGLPRADYAAGIIWHGSVRYSEPDEAHPEHPGDAALRASVPMLIVHGAADEPSPIPMVYDLVQKLEYLGKTVELKVYSGTNHGFTLASNARYHPEHADDAFREGVLFIRRLFGIPIGTVGPLVPQPVPA